MANSNNGGGKIRTDLLVIGGGIAGMTAAIEAAEAGAGAVIVEKNSYLGGRVSQLYQYFPKLCPPSCGLEINFRRIKDQKDNVKVFVDSEVTKIEGESGNYTVTIKQSPRFINENCTACGDCEKACTTEIDNDFNFGMDKHKAVYLPHEMAFPAKYVLKKDACSDDELKAIKDSCQYNAVDLDMTEKEITVECSTITVSTGWKPYEVEKVENLGFGTNKNIITNMMMERLASLNGPTEGKILKPSDGGEVSSVAFVQCAGSRDENHLKYCSAVCCLASMKQATYVRDQYPEAEIHMFYIDVRSPGRLEDFYTKRQEDEKLFFHRGKVAKIVESGSKLTVKAENTLTNEMQEVTVDMAVLATGMVPSVSNGDIPADLTKDEFGFIVPGVDPKSGIIAAGTATRPLEVSGSIQDATGAAVEVLKAMARR